MESSNPGGAGPGGGAGSFGGGPPGGGGHPDPNHVHHAGCGCTEEMKQQDPHGQDLHEAIDLDAVQCFNERKDGTCRGVIRPLD